MHEQYITVRQLLRNYKKFSSSKKTFIITNNGKPEAIFMPYKNWIIPPVFEGKNKNKSREFTLKELEKYSTPSGEHNLSQQIDEIVYGASNPYRNDDNS